MFLGQELFQPSNFTNFIYITSVIFILFLIYSLYLVVSEFYKLKSYSLKALLGLLIICILVFNFLFFPGFSIIDDCFTALAGFAGNASGWQSFTYSAFLATGYMLIGQYGFAPLVFSFLFVVIAQQIFLLIEKNVQNKTYQIFIAILFVFISLNPLNLGFLIFHTRDVLFSILFIGLLVYIIKHSKLQRKHFLKIGLLIAVLADMRSEGLIYSVLIPLFFIIYKKINLKKGIGYLCFVLLASLGYRSISARVFNVSNYSNIYIATTYVLPLSEIFHQVGIEKIEEEILKDIIPVFDVDKLISHYSPTDIDPFHAGAFVKNSTPLDFILFKQAAHKLFLKHWKIIIQSRIRLFLSMLNLGIPPLIFLDEMRMDLPKYNDFKNHLSIQTSEIQMSEKTQIIYNQIQDFLRAKSFFSKLFNSYFIPCLFLLMTLFGYKNSPLFAGFSLLILSRILILVAIAPASYMKYIYFLHLYFIFILPIWIICRINKSDSLA